MSYQVWAIIGGWLAIIITLTCWACWAALHYAETAVYASPAQAIPELEAALTTPLAELVAEAERKAIAEFSPLVGDPWEATVVANPPETVEVVSLVGGGVTRVPVKGYPIPPWEEANRAADWVETTAVGDPFRSYIAPTGSTNTTHYAGNVRVELWGAGGGGSSGTNTITPTYGPSDPPGPALYKDLLHRRDHAWLTYTSMRQHNAKRRDLDYLAERVADIDCHIRTLLADKRMW